ncbi:phytochrome kinase substrate 1-like protein [Tanacetum coccineum]
MIASEKRATSFSYLNAHTTEDSFMLKLAHAQTSTKKKLEDDELGVFGAEKYFKGVIDEELLRTPSAHYRLNQPQERHEEPSPLPKPNRAPSVRSESSYNSRKGLLVSNGNGNGNGNGNDHRKKKSVKSLLASLGCNCNDKDSVKVTHKKVPIRGGDSVNNRKALSSQWVEGNVNIKKDDCFSFPVLNPERLPEVKQEGEQEKKLFSLERKLTMLNWDGVTPRAEALDVSRNGGQNDTGSDASSDLFELESFSTHENNSFLAKQAMDSNDGRLSNVHGYAPSEASVDWSVVTAGVADISNPEDLRVSRTAKVGSSSGILSGCTSLKAVRVSGDEQEKGAVLVGPTRREWCQRLDTATPVAKIQADTKLIGMGPDSLRGQNRHLFPGSIQ